MSDSELEEIRQRVRLATPVCAVLSDSATASVKAGLGFLRGSHLMVYDVESRDDAVQVANCQQDLVKLLAECDRLRRRNEAMIQNARSALADDVEGETTEDPVFALGVLYAGLRGECDRLRAQLARLVEAALPFAAGEYPEGSLTWELQQAIREVEGGNLDNESID